MNAPANLPALITDLSGDASRAPQESNAAATNPVGCCPQCAAPLPGAEPIPTSAEGVRFTRARQVLFLENLSVTGSVRSAASAAQVSHQTAYRARRSQPPFRLAWDAALVAARVHAEGTLACRAIDGVEEKVFYHGEEVGSRTRYSDRLLLAHLARLDKLTEDSRVNAVAEDFDCALARFEAGEEVEPAAPEPAPEEGGLFSSGQCNTRSMSPSELADPPCCGNPRWPRCRACPDFPEVERVLCEMDDARPRGAPAASELEGEWEEVEACQMAAFEAGDALWWRYGAGMVLHARNARGRWFPAHEIAAGGEWQEGMDEEE